MAGTKLANKRSTEVLYEIQHLKTTMQESVFTLGELLLEARDGEYHKDWGYNQFKDWIEDASGLDMGWRQAYYLMNIMERAKKLGYTHEDLGRVKMSKLKEIFTVEDDTRVKELMAGGETMSLEQVKAAVKPDRKYSFLNLRQTKEDKETTLEAIEVIRRLHGSVLNEHGDIVDISEGRAVALMAAEILSYAEKELKQRLDEIKGGEVPVEGSDGIT